MLSRFARNVLVISGLLATIPSLSAAPKLMQGPMVGHIEPTSARIWARTAGEVDFAVLFSTSPNFTNPIITEAARSSAENDFCVEVDIEGLEPSSFYYYKVLLNGQELDSPRENEGYPLLTAPSDNHLVRFTIAFGAGAKTEMDGLQAIWLQVQNARPHVFFWLGDNESAEGLSPAFQAEQYRKQRSVPFLQPLLRSIPQLATWDGLLGGDSGKSLEVFRHYWANPGYGTEGNPGTYFKFTYGRVDFFFLDTYSYRVTGDQPTMLGEDQKAWLKENLANSRAPFKVLLSSSSWTNLKENTDSTWTAFILERDELLSYIKDSDIEGVVLVSGDNDQAEIKAIPMSDIGGYDLYEFTSSPLAQDPTPSFDELEPSTIAIQAPYTASMNFGLISFDMTEVDPSMSFEIINVFGESVYPALEVRASELVNGIASWKTKVDDPEAYAYADEDNKDPNGAL